MRKFLIALLVWVGLIGALAQDRNYSLQIGSITWIGSAGGYNPFSSSAYPNTIDFTITKITTGHQLYAVTAGVSANSGTYNRRLVLGANSLNYQLYTDSTLAGILKAPPAALSSEVIGGSAQAKAGAVLPLSLVLLVPPNQLAPPGTYADQVTIGVFSRYNESGPPQDTKTINVTAFVAAMATLCLVPTGSAFNQASTSQTLDFGTLAKDQSRSCDLLIRKNTACTVRFTSANKGVLRASPQTSGDEIPYTLRVDSTSLSLDSTATVTMPAGVSVTQDGSRLPLVVTIGDPGNASAGDYRDEVTITVTVQ